MNNRSACGGSSRFANAVWARASARAPNRRAEARRHTGLNTHGFTLIEVVAVLTLLTTIMGVGAIAYHNVMSLSRAQGRYEQRRAAAEHFLRRFAQDVREAQMIGAPAGPQLGPALTLAMADGGRVRYFAEGRTLQRAFTASDGDAQQMPMIGDPGMAVRFDAERRDGRVRAVVATVEWQEPPQIGISHPVLSLRVALRSMP